MGVTDRDTGGPPILVTPLEQWFLTWRNSPLGGNFGFLEGIWILNTQFFKAFLSSCKLHEYVYLSGLG